MYLGRHALKRTVVIRSPALPPELWLCIFHHATHVPGTLVPDIYDNASILGPIFIKKYHPALREALITKRALVRVCRQWWHLAIPFLYESVFIGRVRCLYSLSNTLARSAEGKGTLVGARPIGEYTQRLDIVIRDHAKDAAVECELLKDLIACMPHLAIFSVVATSNYADSDLPYSILDALESSTALRVLDWSSTSLKFPFLSLSDHPFDKCTQLHVLNTPDLLWSRDLNQAVFPPTVTTLRCHGMLPFTSHHYEHLALPDPSAFRPPVPLALQELVFVFDFYRTELWEEFFQLYGSQLVSVHFYQPSEWWTEIHTSLRIIARTCPNLRRLTIASDSFLQIVEPRHGPISLPITITYLGLRVEHPNTSKADFEMLFWLLEHLRQSSMPSLRVVQLLNERIVQCLFTVHTKFAMSALRPFLETEVPFWLEDEDGVLLTDRLKVLGCP